MSTQDTQESRLRALEERVNQLTGVKQDSSPIAENEYADIKICAIMSVPMCGWNPHWGCVSETLRPFGIPIRLGFGAFWGNMISNMLEDLIADGIDWALTFDYDSITTPENLSDLISRFGRRGDIDALAALQCKRSTEELPLMTFNGQHEVEVTDEPIRADTAHFGMTLIRLDALKEVPKPWFLGLPDNNGSYKTMGRVDSDIYFWNKWKAFNKTLYVDPNVSIGHLQPLVSEYDENLKPVHTHYVNWRKRTKGEVRA